MKILEKQSVPLVVGEAAAAAEAAALGAMINPVYRLRMRHPLLYGLIAFVMGGGIVALFTMSTYGNWAYEGIDLKLAFYQVIFGSIGGGLVMTVLAFAYIRTIRPSIAPMAADRITASRG
jgi:hypothetical protein